MFSHYKFKIRDSVTSKFQREMKTAMRSKFFRDNNRRRNIGSIEHDVLSYTDDSVSVDCICCECFTHVSWIYRVLQAKHSKLNITLGKPLNETDKNTFSGRKRKHFDSESEQQTESERPDRPKTNLLIIIKWICVLLLVWKSMWRSWCSLGCLGQSLHGEFLRQTSGVQAR